MEKGTPPGIFVNDGSFMEKFKQLQQQNPTDRTTTRSAIDTSDTPSSLESGSLSSKKAVGIKISDTKKPGSSSSGGKLAFSLKQKSKVAAPAVKLAEDDEDEERGTESQSNEETTKRQKISQTGFSGSSHSQGSFAPSPSDSAVKNVADKLASFVAKNGRQFEDITRQKNPGDTPFKFLFDTSCPDYKYYDYRLLEEEKALVQTKDSHSSYIVSNSTPTQKTPSGSQRSYSAQHPNYQTPASALYGTRGETSPQSSSAGGSSAPSASDPIAMMEFYMKKAAQEERKRQPRYSKDEMPPPASLQVPVKKGHHMGDYIPQEELDKFLSSCNDAAAQKAAKEAAERAKIQADNVGHKLLSKMGWKEGEGLGSSKSGRADPVMAGNVKLNNLGVGAEQPGEVTPEDDIYEQYKKRMMLGYRHRPNPLNNPRKAYY